MDKFIDLTKSPEELADERLTPSTFLERRAADMPDDFLTDLSLDARQGCSSLTEDQAKTVDKELQRRGVLDVLMDLD